MPPLLLVVDLQRPWPRATGPTSPYGNGRVAALHDRFLQAVGGSDSWPPAWLEGNWWQDRRLDALRPEFAAERAALAGTDLPVVVDPRLAFALPLWREAEPGAQVLLLCGAPWSSEDPELQGTCLARWEAFHAAALRHSEAMDRRLWYQPEPADARAILAWLESRLQPRRMPAEFVTWLQTSRALAETTAEEVLSPSQSLLRRGLMAIGQDGALEPAASGTVVTGALRSASAHLEEALFAQALSLHERVGRTRQATEAAHRELAELEQGLRELERRKRELSLQLAVASSEAEGLHDQLKSRLGEWCSLDESMDVGARIQDTLRTIEAVHNSWTWRFARLLTLPARMLHRLYLATLAWRRAEPKVAGTAEFSPATRPRSSR